MTKTLLSIERLSKAYPGVVANDSVSLEINTGEVHALLGENGAGKSTLVKMIYGLVRPDSGNMRMHEKPFGPASPG
ncbi:MAG: ATP-binding cassette domain-containing protein, partial [Pseudomonadota bacterium]